jgi:hypothetical protein
MCDDLHTQGGIPAVARAAAGLLVTCAIVPRRTEVAQHRWRITPFRARLLHVQVPQVSR